MAEKFTLNYIKCLEPSTGTSNVVNDVFEAIGAVAGGVLGGAAGAVATTVTGGALILITGASAVAGVGAGEAVAEQIVNLTKKVGSLFPDNLYIKLNDKKVWPSGSDYKDVDAQKVITITDVSSTTFPITLTLMEWDYFSDDLLAEIQVTKDASLGTTTLVIANKDENSIYEINYSIT